MADTEEGAAVLEQLFVSIKLKDESTVSNIVLKHPEVINEHHDSKNGWGKSTALIEACYSGSLEIVQTLIKNGADVHKTGYVLERARINNIIGRYVPNDGKNLGGLGIGTHDDIFPLYIATKTKEMSVILELLEAGADVHQRNATGMTALHRATYNFDDDVLKSPPNVEESADGTEHAEPEESVGKQILRVLIKHGSDVNAQDYKGKTPLHYACETCMKFYPQILVEAGADIYISDMNGWIPLDTAAMTSWDMMERVIQLGGHSLRDIVEAYETVAINCHQPYEILKATTMLRQEHNLPKKVLNPIKAFGMVKEWETLEELEQYEGDPGQIILQAVLARERIFGERGFDILDESMSYKMEVVPITIHDPKEMHLYSLSNVIENGNHWYFCDSFFSYGIILIELCARNGFLMDEETVCQTADVVLECCDKIQKDLFETNQPALAQQLIAQYHNTMAMVTFLIYNLIERSLSGDDELNEKAQTTPEDDQELAKKLFVLFYTRFPALECPLVGYRRPLAHVLLDKATCCFFPIRYDYNDHYILKMFMQFGFDIHETDSQGNTLLHVLVSSRPKLNYMTIRILRKNGAHLHARNDEGKTAMDIMRDPDYKEMDYKPLLAILDFEDHKHLPSLQCIAAREVRKSGISYKGDEDLPKKLIKFVNFH